VPNLDRQNLLIASFNVLNYFTTLDMDGYLCGPLFDQNCRGADSEEEFARQRAKLLAALGGIQADVFGLVEIQNDQDQSAADLVSGLNALLGSGTYTYIPTGFIGGDAIKVSLLYRPARVAPLGNFALLTSAADPRFIDTLNRPVLAQSFTDLTNGKTFTVAVNHLKSKSSACPDDPDLGDGQGNCNLTRTAAAQALVDWLAGDPTGSGVTDFLIIGDLNAYDKEDPIDAVKLGADDAAGSADDYVDLVNAFLGEQVYTYVFDGQLGYLDHALANRSLAGKVARVDVWHINADEPDLIDYNLEFKQPAQDALWAPDAYRASDHDPVIVSLNLDTTYLVMDDVYATPVDTPLIVASPGVMSNDSQTYLGDALSVQLKTDVANGSLSLNPDGSFIFTPEPGFSGWVSYVYELLSSIHGVVGEATVTLTVVEENIVYLPVVIGQH
jgi:predicted extracellular nuclease